MRQRLFLSGGGLLLLLFTFGLAYQTGLLTGPTATKQVSL
jgi:hypothetical protein